MIESIKGRSVAARLREELAKPELSDQLGWHLYLGLRKALFEKTDWRELTSEVTRARKWVGTGWILDQLREREGDVTDLCVRGMMFLFLEPGTETGNKLLRRYACELEDVPSKVRLAELALWHPDRRLRRIGEAVELPAEHLTPKLVQRRLAHSSWEQVASLASNPHALKVFDFARLGVPDLDALEKVVAGFERETRLERRAQTLALRLVEQHTDGLASRPDLLRRVCRLGGAEAVKIAATQLPDSALQTGTLALLEVMRELISELPAGEVSDAVAAAQSAIFVRWDREPAMARHMPHIEAITLVNLTVVLRAQTDVDLDRRVEDVAVLTGECRNPEFLRWALRDIIATVQRRLPETESLAIPLRELIRMARWHTGWSSQDHVATLQDLCRRGISPQTLHILMLPQLFRGLDDTLARDEMEETCLGSAEMMVDGSISTAHILVVLGSLSELGCQSPRLQAILERRRGVAAAYAESQHPGNGLSKAAGVIAAIALRHRIDVHDELWHQMVVPDIERVAKEAVGQFASVNRAHKDEKFEWLFQELERIVFGLLCRRPNGSYTARFRQLLDERLEEDCRQLDPGQRHIILSRLAACLCAGDLNDRQALLAKAVDAGLFLDRRPIFELLGGELFNRVVALETAQVV